MLCPVNENILFAVSRGSLKSLLKPVSTSANLVARTDTIACSSIEKKQSDWLSLILVAKTLNLIQLPELTGSSQVNARFQLEFRAAHALITHRLVARLNSPKWEPALIHQLKLMNVLIKVMRVDDSLINSDY